MLFIVDPDLRTLAHNVLPSKAQETESALARLLSSIEKAGGPGPAGSAFRQALRRHGQRLVAFVGAEGLEAISARLSASAGPQHAEARRALLTEAWAGLPGATP